MTTVLSSLPVLSSAMTAERRGHPLIAANEGAR